MLLSLTIVAIIMLWLRPCQYAIQGSPSFGCLFINFFPPPNWAEKKKNKKKKKFS